MAESTKNKILKIGLQLFSGQGFNQTSLQEIADKCGIAQTTVLYHFKSKHGLLSEIIDQAIAHNRDHYLKELPATITAKESLRRFLRTNLEWCYQNQSEAHVLIMLFNFTKMDSNLKEKATYVIDTGRRVVFEFLQAWRDEENIEVTDKGLRQRAMIIQQFVNAAMFQILVRIDSPEEYKKSLENLDLFLQRALEV